MKKLLFSGEIPPKSVHGIANSNEINIRFLSERFHVLIDEEIVDLRFHGELSFCKFKNYLTRLVRIISFSLKNKFEYFYIVFSTSRAGAIKTLLIISLFRIFNFSSICIVHLHRGDLDIFVDKSFFNKLLFRIVLKITHRLIVLSAITQDYIELKFDKSHAIFVLPNTVNIEYEFDAEWTSANKKIQFLYISNYIQGKGILLLLDTFKQIDEDFQLNCYGNFSDEDLKEKILTYCSEKIKINGPIFGREKFLAIQQSDALILPSFNEGKPIVLLEALSLGTPIIAPNVGYIKEMVFDEYPFIYNKNTSKDLFDMIIEFSKLSISEKIILRNSLKRYYRENYSNIKHKDKLFQIFGE